VRWQRITTLGPGGVFGLFTAGVALVAGVSIYVPRSTCLAQALAMQVLLGRCGHPASLRIGVARSEARRDDYKLTHGWKAMAGLCLVTPKTWRAYTPLPPLEGERPSGRVVIVL